MRSRWFRAGRLATVLAVLALGIAGCSGKKKDEVELIRQSGVLRVALVDTGSGFTSVKGNEPVGVEPELASYVGEMLGVSTEFLVCGRQEALEKVAAGEADIGMGCISREGDFSDKYRLSDVYGKGFCYVVTIKGDFVGTIGGLNERTVGVEQNLNEVTKSLLYAAEGISLADYSDSGQAAEDLKEGRIQGYVCYEKQARALLEDEDLQVQNLMNLEQEEYVIVAPAGSDKLVSGINTLIRQFLEER